MESESVVDSRRRPARLPGWRLACAASAQSRHRWSSCAVRLRQPGATQPSEMDFLRARAVEDADAASSLKSRHATRPPRGPRTGARGQLRMRFPGQTTSAMAGWSSSPPPVHPQRLQGAMGQWATRPSGRGSIEAAAHLRPRKPGCALGHWKSDLSSPCKQYMYHTRVLPSPAHLPMLSSSEPSNRTLRQRARHQTARY